MGDARGRGPDELRAGNLDLLLLFLLAQGLAPSGAPVLRRPKTKSSEAFALLACGWAARAPRHQHPAHNSSTEEGQKELVQGSEVLSRVTEGGDVVGKSPLARGAHS